MATVLVTGAGRGIGLALVKIYLERGDRVLATVRDPARAAPLTALGARPGANLRVYRMDVADGASVAEARGVIGDLPIDILINNAGVIGPDRQGALDMDFEGFATTLATNTLGPLRIAQAFAGNLRAAKGGRLATISSRMGSFSSEAGDHLAYRASKAAVNKVMQGLGGDLKEDGVAVVTLHPGWVRTDMGGAGADVDVTESAKGIVAVIDRLDLATTGRFVDYQGDPVAW